MGLNHPAVDESRSFSSRMSLLEEPDRGGTVSVRGSEISVISTAKEPEDIRLEPLSVSGKLKKTGLSGYSRSSVDAYVSELRRSSVQLRDNMKQQLASLSSECARLKSESQVLRGQLAQAEEQTGQVRNRLLAVTAERDAAESRSSEKDTELQDMEARMSACEAEYAQIEEVKTALREKTEEAAALREENTRLRGRLQELSRSVKQIRDEVAAFKKQTEKDGAETSRLRQELRSLRDENDDLRSELKALRKKRDKNAKREGKKEKALRLEEYVPAVRRPEPSAAYRPEEPKRSSVEDLQSAVQELLDEIQRQQELYDRLSSERAEGAPQAEPEWWNDRSQE